MKSAIFFDRDGILNQLVNRDHGEYSPQNFIDFKISNNAKKITEYTSSLGFLNIVVSNQPDISRGMLEMAELNKMTAELYNKLVIDDVFYCLHDDNMCECRKPLPGLIFAAQNKWNIDLNASLMIGDTQKDFYAAKNANIDFYLISHTLNSNIKVKNRIKDIIEIINIIN